MGPTAKKLIVLAVTSALILSTFVMIYSLLQNKKLSAILETEVTPTDSVIMINGKKTNERKNKVKPGNYTIVFKRQGFKDYEIKVSLDKGETRYAGSALIPADTKYINWYKENPDEARKAEGISSKSSDQAGRLQLESFPFLKSLPWIMTSYRIDYGVSQKYSNDSSKFAIYITYENNTAKQNAIRWLESQGADISKLEIVYKATKPVRNLNP